MPRRKSIQSSSLKRPPDEETEHEAAASKQSKPSEPGEPTADDPLKVETLSPRSSQDGGTKMPVARKVKPKVEPVAGVFAVQCTQAPSATVSASTIAGEAVAVTSAALSHVGEEMVVLTRTLSPDNTQSPAGTGNGNGGKPNRSLEALFQVTDSELQNMRQESPTHPATSSVSLPSAASPPITAAATTTIPIGGATTTTQSIVVLSNVGPGVISQDGIRFIIAEDASNVGATIKPLHHHKAAILQHHHQQLQQQQQQQLQQQQVSPQGVILAAGASGAEKKPPALGSILHNTKMKLVYTKQVHDSGGSEGSFASTSTSLGSVASLDASDEGFQSSSIDSSNGNVAAVAPSSNVGRKRKHPQKPGRYVCNFCGRGCAKPSVLQKHLRAHTGERPYPCLPCGFSFKTKSNLYKHRKSLAHALKVGQVEKDPSSYTSSSVEDSADVYRVVERSETKDILEESGGDSEGLDSEAEGNVEEEEVTVVKEESVCSVDGSITRELPVSIVSTAHLEVPARDASISSLSPTVPATHLSGGRRGAQFVTVDMPVPADPAPSSGTGSRGASQEKASAQVFDKPVREEHILESIRQKIDKNKLMEWSRQMDRIKHQEHVELLHVHSNFPTRIAPKSDSSDEYSGPAGSQSLPHGFSISMNSDQEEVIPVRLMPAHPSNVSSSLSVPVGDNCEELPLPRQVSAPAVLDSALDPPSSAQHTSPRPPGPQAGREDSKHSVTSGKGQLDSGESSSEGSHSRKSLQKLDTLSDKFPESEGCTYTFKTLPDNAIQVTIHMAKDAKENPPRRKSKLGASKSQDDRLYSAERQLTKSSSVSDQHAGESGLPGTGDTAGPARSQHLGAGASRLAPRMPPLLSRSVSADTKTLTTAMLKERIQQLISANAAIVDMPMADAPRTKGRFSRQNSDSGFQSWKLTEQGAASRESAGSSSELSVPCQTPSSKISIPTISSVPLQPMVVEGEASVSGLVTSLSLDTGHEKGPQHRDLRRSISASGVRMGVPPTIVRTFHDSDLTPVSKSVGQQQKEMHVRSASLTQPTSHPQLSVVSEGSMASVSLISADGTVSIPASLPVEVINAISSASGSQGKGEIKLQFRIGKSEQAGAFCTDKESTVTSSSPITMIGQPGVQFPKAEAGSELTGGQLRGNQDNSVIKNLLQKGAAPATPNLLTPPSLMDPVPTTRPPKLKSEMKGKSADAAYSSPQIVRSSLGAQQVVLTIKDIHSKSMDSASSQSLEQTKVVTVRDELLGVRTSRSTSQLTRQLSTESHMNVFTTSTPLSHSPLEAAATASKGESERGEGDAMKKFVCGDCSSSFHKSHLLNMHKMFYCGQAGQGRTPRPPTIQVETVGQEPQGAEEGWSSTPGDGTLGRWGTASGADVPSSSNTLTVPSTHPLPFQPQTKDDHVGHSSTRRAGTPTFLKSHSTTEMEARSTWQKEDYPQLRSQLTLRPSQSVDESGSRSESSKPQQNFIIENIDPLLPPKKGRPKGSKNKPKDLNMILAKASAKASAAQAFAAVPASGFSPVKVISLTDSPAGGSLNVTGSPSGQSPLAGGLKPGPRLILPRSQPLLTPVLSVAQPTTTTTPASTTSAGNAAMIGQPMISMQPISVDAKGDSGKKCMPIFATQPDMLSSATGFPLAVPSLVTTPEGTAILTPTTPGTPGTPGTPPTDPQSLWKLKLKGRLLMKRSISEQKMATFVEVEKKAMAKSLSSTSATPSPSSSPQSATVPTGKPGISPLAIHERVAPSRSTGVSSPSVGAQLSSSSLQESTRPSLQASSPEDGVTSHGSVRASKAPSSGLAQLGLLHPPLVLRTMSEPGLKTVAMTNIPKLEMLSGVSTPVTGSRIMTVASGSKSLAAEKRIDVAAWQQTSGAAVTSADGGDTEVRVMVTGGDVGGDVKVSQGEAILVSSQFPPIVMPVSVPVVLAQPVFINTPMIPSGAYRHTPHLPFGRPFSKFGSDPEPSSLTSVVITGSNLTLPAIPVSSLLNPALPQPLPLTPTSMVLAPRQSSGCLSPSQQFASRSPSGSFDKTLTWKNGTQEKGAVRLATPSQDRLLSSEKLHSSPDTKMVSDKVHPSPDTILVSGDGRAFSEDRKTSAGAASVEKGEAASRVARMLSLEKASPGTLPAEKGGEGSPKVIRMLSMEERKELSASTPATPIRVPLFLYGHSYPTLHASTFVTFCCVKRPQPMYVQVKGSNRRVSMYSNWRLSTHNPNPVGLTSRMLLALYRSRYTANPTFASCAMLQYSVTHSSYWQYQRKLDRHSGRVRALLSPISAESGISTDDPETSQAASGASECSTPTSERAQGQDGSSASRGMIVDVKLSSSPSALTKEEVMEILNSKGGPVFRGGYKSEDMYEYIRGRGRGKYVCESCGIRCKKPSMLKKHLRTHTDFRPYHCHHCKFSFKTKGNLTKHMKSKAHQKRCVELGIFPVPVTVEDSQIDEDALAKQCAIAKDARILDNEMRGRASLGTSSLDAEGEDDDDDEGDENEEEEEEEEDRGQEGEERAKHGDRVSRGMSDPGMRPQVLMAARESERAPLQRSMAITSASRDLTSTPNLDTEIARSLLDLSRKVEAQGTGEVSARVLESDEACQNAITRLDSLIGALMSRTKPLSGLKLGADNSPIVVHIKELEGDSVGLIISQESQAGKGGTTPVITIDSVSDDEETDSQTKTQLVTPSTLSPTPAVAAATASMASSVTTVATSATLPLSSLPPSVTATTASVTGPSRPTHLSLLKPPSLGTVTITLSPSATTGRTLPGSAVTSATATRLQPANLPSPSLMKFLPAYMSAHKFPGYTPTSQGPIVGQLIPKAGSVGGAGREGWQSSGGGASSAQTPLQFQFNSPFLEILQRQNSLQLFGAAPTTTTTTTTTATTTSGSVLSSSWHRPISSQSSSESSGSASTGGTEGKAVPAELFSLPKVALASADKGGDSNSILPPPAGTLPAGGGMVEGEFLLKGRVEGALFPPRSASPVHRLERPGESTTSTPVKKPVVPADVQQISTSESESKFPTTRADGEGKFSDLYPALKFTCDICDAAFASHQQAMRHRSSHFKSLKCSVCLKSFQSEGQLKRHQMADGHLPPAIIKVPSVTQDGEETEKVFIVPASTVMSAAAPKQLACHFCSMVFRQQYEQTAEHQRSQSHLSALERLGMLPSGSYHIANQEATVRHTSPITSHSPVTVVPADAQKTGERERVMQVKCEVGPGASSSPRQNEEPARAAPGIQRTLSKGAGAADSANSIALREADSPKPDARQLQSPVVVKLSDPSGLNSKQTSPASLYSSSVQKSTDWRKEPSGLHASQKKQQEETVSPAKKPKLQHLVLHSIDSDADGDSHLVIDEGQGQGESSRSRTVEQAGQRVRALDRQSPVVVSHAPDSSFSALSSISSSPVPPSLTSTEGRKTIFVRQKAGGGDTSSSRESDSGIAMESEADVSAQSELFSGESVSPSKRSGLDGALTDEAGIKRETQEYSGPVCGLCAAHFATVQELKAHLMTHTELRPFVCEFCDAGFTNAQSLRTHLHTHRQECPYICGLCGDTFAQSEDLRVHHASHSKTSIIRPTDDPPASSSPIPSASLPPTSKMPPLRASSVPKPQIIMSSSLTVPLMTVHSLSFDSSQRKRARSPGEYSNDSFVPQAKRPAVAVATEERRGGGLQRSLSSVDSSIVRESSESVVEAAVSRLSPLAVVGKSREEDGSSATTQVVREVRKNPDRRLALLPGLSASSSRREASPQPQGASPSTLDMSPNRLDALPGRLDASSHRLTVSPHRLETSPNRMNLSPNRLNVSPNRMSPAGVFPVRRSSQVLEHSSSDENVTAGPSGRRLSQDTRGSDHTGRERRPTICRQNEIEIGDQDLPPDDPFDDDDGVFQDKAQSLCDDNLTGFATGTQNTASKPPEMFLLREDRRSEVALVPDSSQSLTSQHCRLVTSQGLVSDSTGVAAQTLRLQPPAPASMQSANQDYSVFPAFQHPQSQHAAFRQQGGEGGAVSFERQGRGESTDHLEAVPTHHPLHLLPLATHSQHVVESTEEDMDSEVQSYFADHVDLTDQNMSAAVLLNDRDSDDPQLLVCEEDMVTSSKDGTPDMRDGDGEGESGVGSDHTPGERNADWDDWGSLSIGMQPGDADTDPDVALVRDGKTQ